MLKYGLVMGVGAVILLVVGALLGGVLVGRLMAHGGNGSLIHACVLTRIGLVRIVGSDESCRPSETALDWNIQGPAGPQGETGPQGEQGPKGDPGPEPTSMDWANVTNKPAGFADDTDNDALGGLVCEEWQIPRRKGSGWICGDANPIFTDLYSFGGAGVGFTSIATGADGLGLISFFDATNHDLMVAHCENVRCTKATVTKLDDDATLGQTSVAIGSDGLGLISYSFSNNLHVAHCSNVACTSAVKTTLDTIINSSMRMMGSSIVIGVDGLGIISYFNEDTDKLTVAHCENVLCTDATITPLDSASGQTSITVGGDGLALISYARSQAALKTAHCENLACTSATITTHIGDIPNSGGQIHITTGADGLGLIAFDAPVQNGRELRVAHCQDAACASVAISTVDRGGVGGTQSITIGDDGLGFISYNATLGNENGVKVAHCEDIACTSAITSVLDTFANAGRDIAVTIGSDSLPLISYVPGIPSITNGLRVAHCANAVFCR